MTDHDFLLTIGDFPVPYVNVYHEGVRGKSYSLVQDTGPLVAYQVYRPKHESRYWRGTCLVAGLHIYIYIVKVPMIPVIVHLHLHSMFPWIPDRSAFQTCIHDSCFWLGSPDGGRWGLSILEAISTAAGRYVVLWPTHCNSVLPGSFASAAIFGIPLRDFHWLLGKDRRCGSWGNLSCQCEVNSQYIYIVSLK